MMHKATRRALAGVVAVLLSGAPAALGADDVKPFPDEWFFSGSNRPQGLRDLEGKKATEIDAAEWRGESVRLEDLRGKVVVLDFWATWCGPCMAAIPHNVEMVDKYKDEDVVLVGIHDAASGWDKVDKVIADKNINYSVALDAPSKTTQKAYNLQFWPTYVVIDREGVIRGAGLIPSHVEEAVKQVLAEPWDGPAKNAAPKGGGFPDDWFYGADKRPAWRRAAEGQPMKPLKVTDWVGEPLGPKATERRVVVVQFVNPGFARSLADLESLNPIVEKYARQGVAFVGIALPDSDPERLARAAKAREVTMPIGIDAPAEKDQKGTGATAATFGVRNAYAPVTAVVDRAGVVRAVGLKTEHLEPVINALLAERLPAQPAEGGAANGDE